jgi:hydroxymethylglutaryl-CoA synthase
VTNRTIEAVGVYTPRYRVTAETFQEVWGSFQAPGVEEKAVPAGDEDAVTMAVSAAQRALADSDHDPEEFGSIAFGTTTPPMAEGDIGAQVAEILGFPTSAEISVFTQSTRAGTRALVSATRMTDAPTLVIAADCPFGAPDNEIDHGAGAGAVALVVAADGVVDIVETAAHTREFPGTRYRESGNRETETYGATAYERDAFVRVTAGAVQRLDEVAPAIAPTATDGRLPHRITKELNDVTVHHRASSLGDTGAASPLFGMVDAWEGDAEHIVIAGFGDGASADAVRLQGRLPVSVDRETISLTYADYLQRRGHIVPTEGGDR